MRKKNVPLNPNYRIFNYIRMCCLAFFVLLISGNLNAQSNSFWKIENDNKTDFNKSKTKRLITPQKYVSLSVDIDALSEELADAPTRFTQEAKQKTKVITLPLANGEFEQYRVFKVSVMHPELAKKFPEIQTFAGYSVNDPSETVRFDISPQGFNGMIRSGSKGTMLIAPYSQFNREYCMAYFKKDNERKEPFSCGFDEVNHIDPRSKKSTDNPLHKSFAGDCSLRTYRLALACTGEYAAFHGGTEPLVMAAYNTTMNRVNGVYETDVNVTLVLVPNTNNLIFYNAGSDPYTNNNGGAMLGENQTTCDNVIGSNNYDIGHVLSTGGGGVAYLGGSCTGSKAGGVTGQSSPVGDPFDIDYVAHEMGHQFGAEHTQNNSCQRSVSSVEPGSASTIMGYAGICAPNVQNNSDPYFHAISIGEITNFITGLGNSCAVTTNTSNNSPTADAGNDYTIPGGTSFVLTGIGTDPDDNTLTYCWEQMDNEVATMPPTATNAAGPAFRTFVPTTSTQRYLPNLTDIVNNVNPTWETLAEVDRQYDWRMTVRDNNPNSGCTAEDDMTVTVDGDSGPFLVNVPNGGESWHAQSIETVTWDVAGTTNAPVNAATVDILLSTDGGFTYPITIATGVVNDGSEVVVVPNNIGTNNRIMIKGGNNIFFDISNANFDIIAPVAGNACDDGDPCTINDVFDGNLVCSGELVETDSDNDGVCDPADQCPNMDDSIIGTACDDGDATTENDVYNNTCNCMGTPLPTCDDNIQNGEETGLDCGGPDCAPCPLNYCASQSDDASGEYISRVQLADINNPSGASFYSDFTNISTELTAETAYTITVTPTWTGSLFPESYRVWIDYNQDGDFTDSGEEIWTQENSPDSPISGNFTVPASALSGSTRMRVSMKFFEAPESCESFEYGEVEDYTVIIKFVCPAPGTTCDDADDCTVNDVYDNDCNCVGTFMDSDSDSVCDINDECPGFDDGLGLMNLDIRVLLEGPYDTIVDEMITTLNERGLLPGKTPLNNAAPQTPPGHPYSIAPWNYNGAEGANWTDTNYTNDAVDWLLVSLRTDITKNSEVAMTPAIVNKDGSLAFPNGCALTVSENTVYIVVEHRNHLAVMTATPVNIANNTLSYDFSQVNSYDASGTGAGQKELTPGIWAMYAGDADQVADFPSYDIKGGDKAIWFENNGSFDLYTPADFNLDGDINGGDKSIWAENNGISSRVPK